MDEGTTIRRGAVLVALLVATTALGCAKGGVSDLRAPRKGSETTTPGADPSDGGDTLLCGAEATMCCRGGLCDDGLTCVSGTCTGRESCGSEGMGCCSGGACAAELVCVESMCRAEVICGRRGERCCAGDTCSAGQVCRAGICEPTGAAGCGDSGERCCDGDSCASGLVCEGGRCATAPACGGAGQACCRGSACNPGLSCSSGRCQSPDRPSCGGAGEACCPGDRCTGSGLSCCGGSCLDTRSSDRNCGGCGTVCGSGERCTAGRCTGGTTTEPARCGKDGQVCCTTGEACVAGLACNSGRCSRPSVDDGRTPACTPAGDGCTAASACCSSLSCRETGGTRRCCAAASASCSTDNDCCGQTTCNSSGRCQCRTASQTCSDDADCCSGLSCEDGVCAAPAGSDPCTGATCDECTADAGCGFCGATSACMRGSADGPSAGACAGDAWKWYPSDCSAGTDCSGYADCGSCTDTDDCVWCETGTCMNAFAAGVCDVSERADWPDECGGAGGRDVPAAWTCTAAWYDASDGCDCGCGVRDPDCDESGVTVYGCDEGETCDAAGACAGGDSGGLPCEDFRVCVDCLAFGCGWCGGEVLGTCRAGSATGPSAGTCAEWSFGATSMCGGGGPGGVPAAWTCLDSYYDADDGCDCGCGVRDPDCDDAGATLYGCDPGETCGASGACVGGASPPPSGGPPSSWTCTASYWDADDGCDCGCGARDPDCDDAGATLYGCDPGQTCSASGACTGAASPPPSGGPPSSWTCTPSYWDGDDGCDCNCGARDPDCDDAGATLYGCDPGQTCSASGACTGGAAPPPPSGGPPASWTCSTSFWAAGDGCDCGCGARDPDCDDAGATVYGCDPGQTCSATGACTGGGSPPPSGGGCSDTCTWAGDGVCDDGGSGSSFSVCALGTDCADCGPR